jgi:aspartyl protease family protein
MVMSVAQGRADLIVNGTAVRQLRAGQTSPEGVRLVSATRTEAVVEIDGKLHTLGLGQSNLAEVQLRADPRGHFVTTALINGQPTQAVVDTGATAVSLSLDEARRMGIDLASAQRVQVSTAAGPRTAYRVVLATVRVGDIALDNVEGVVIEGGRDQLPITLLGMSFLNSVEMRRVGDTLTLSRRR